MKDTKEVLDAFQNTEEHNLSIPEKLTVLPLRDIIIFPNMIFPALIGRASSLKAVAEAIERDKFIFVTAQKNPNIDEPEFGDIYQKGVTSKIIQALRLPNNLLKVLLEGLYQSKIDEPSDNEEYMEAIVKPINIQFDPKDTELKALMRRCSDLFAEYIKENQSLPPDLVGAFENIEDPLRKMYFAASNIRHKVEVKQKILNLSDLKKQYFKLTTILSQELEMLKLEDEIDDRVQDRIQKTQKKFYIQEQIRALQNELDEDNETSPELSKLKEMIDDSGMPDPVYEKAIEEFDRLRKTPMMSPEFGVTRTYLEWLAQIPWDVKTDDNLDIEHVKKILDEDHYDLDKPKERILEFIAVLNLAGALRRQILCFVGPPGVGKTSLGRSIARALGREFARFSLGGVRDEAEIRGHRRTYVGALPGKIIQSMKKAGTINPVILLDEIDKLSSDFRGDPSSALLEALDPEQNESFNDHYLEVDYDLSNALFITTANVKYEIPLALRDRMEIIELNSYLEPTKIEIAKRHLIPKLVEEYGFSDIKIDFTNEAISTLIDEYTREAGVRNLERSIGSILRKLAKEIVSDYDKKRKTKSKKIRKKALKSNPYFKKAIENKVFEISPDLVRDYLRAPAFKKKRDDLEDKIGSATGLAWTSVGGDTMPIEVTIMPGPEKLTLTGKLGDVMKESASAALSHIRSNLDKLGIPEDFRKDKEIHVHVPEGAIPKDGPSAGIAIASALVSAAAQKPVRGDLAMTGEITLRGSVLPIGGLNEKLLAAQRAGIKEVIVPADNEPDVVEVDDDVKKGLKITYAKEFADVAKIIFHEEGESKR